LQLAELTSEYAILTRTEEILRQRDAAVQEALVRPIARPVPSEGNRNQKEKEEKSGKGK
jgi:hypothetical protein